MKKYSNHIAVILSTTFSTWLLFGEVLRTPFWNDDHPNSMRAAVLAFLDEGPMHYALRMSSQWSKIEGRYFPISAIENVHLFVWVTSRGVFKIIQLSSIFLIGWILVLLIFEITRSKRFSFLSLYVYLSAIQVRNWFDPTIGFGLLLQSVSIKFLLTLWLSLVFLRITSCVYRVGVWLAASLLWATAVFQYEITVFIWPVIVLTMFCTNQGSFKRKAIGVLASAIPTFAAVIVSLILRSGINTSESYTIAIGMNFWRTFAQQIVAGLPASTSVFLEVDNWSGRSWLAMMTIVLCIFHVLRLTSQTESNSLGQSKRTLITLGLGLTVLPAIPVAISRRWQSEMTWGLGYLPVFIQYIGVSTTIVALFVILSDRLRRNSRLIQRMFNLVFAFSIGVMGGVHTAGFEDVVQQIHPIAKQRELFEDSVRSGLFREIPKKASILSSNYSHNSWFNPWYYQWLGGLKSHRLASIEGDLPTSCKLTTEYEQCEMSGPWWGFVELIVNEKYTVNVVGQYRQLESESMKSLLVTNTVKMSSHHLQLLPEECMTDLEKTRYGNWIASCSPEIDSFSKLETLLKDLG